MIPAEFNENSKMCEALAYALNALEPSVSANKARAISRYFIIRYFSFEWSVFIKAHTRRPYMTIV